MRLKCYSDQTRLKKDALGNHALNTAFCYIARRLVAYPDWGILWFSSVCLGCLDKCCDHFLKHTTTASFPIHPNSYSP